ncbi:type II toxin-antitoxin system HicB family antitoxin [Haloarcula amylovorans]|uniref:type II toxin-antitoxin system HicB family antitoxin n=1 Tax=Haloarcula amylovorans TaxID=2562280 RepID=UPI001075F497|nr:type II toxin-antitoxin system HicB family antitoxin [Halomicroarcula amylolytica]
MARADAGNGTNEREIRLIENPDGKWTARNLQAGLTAEGDTRAAALENLDAVVEAVDGDGGHNPTDGELRDLGIDPDVARTQGDELPDILK